MHVPDLFFDEQAEIRITRRNLPHWQQDGKLYFVTWRQGDSLPSEKREQLQRDRDAWQRLHGSKKLKDLPLTLQKLYYQLFDHRVQQWLDAGSGSCVLKQQRPRRIVVDALHHFNGTRYTLGTFAVAGNHVHVLVAPLPGMSLSKIVHSWKSFTANAINEQLQRTGALWKHESYNHLVRNEGALDRISDYILRHAEQGHYVEEHPF
jgi:REP element-mobilizing transposase RayT